MRKFNKKKTAPYILAIVLLLLTSCSNYTGLRTPLYDGKPIKPKEAEIEVYRSSGEVTGAEKEFYIRYPFSEDILNKSLDYSNEEPFLLKEGRYLIGEDLPAGRVTLLGNESSFSTENYDVHVGNLIVRDEAGNIYFENLFHSEYGQLTAQLDLLPGHEITIIGTESEITVFYEERLPKDPYILMDVPDLTRNLDRINVQQPLEITGNGRVVHLAAGIYEVGLHLDAGKYALSDMVAPHNTEMYIFSESSSPRVIELLIEEQKYLEDSQDLEGKIEVKKDEDAKIELSVGDKIYLNLVTRLELVRLTEE